MPSIIPRPGNFDIPSRCNKKFRKGHPLNSDLKRRDMRAFRQLVKRDTKEALAEALAPDPEDPPAPVSHITREGEEVAHIRMHDLDAQTAREIRRVTDCETELEVIAFRLCCDLNDIVTIGKTIAEPVR